MLGAGASDGNRIDRLEVAGIRDQVNVNFLAAACQVFAGRAHVIFHIAAAKHAARIDIFESRKNFFRSPLRHMGNDVQAPTMTHAHDQFDRAPLRCGIQNFIDQRQ